jgi:hypothetical protein
VLNKLDEYPIHQTPEPIAHSASSDRNVYDRSWYNGYSEDGDRYFGVAMGLYPHRGVLDCAFSVVERGGRQHSFFASRRAPLERSEMSAGPFRIEVVEPMRRIRVVLDDNATGLACDLAFSARTAPIEEKRQTMVSGTRRALDLTRFDQFGRWTGTIRHPDGEIAVDDARWWGTRDRSWGNKQVGEPESGGPPVAFRGTAFVWCPLVWEDHVTHAMFYDGPDGDATFRDAMTAPLYTSEAAIPDPVLPTDTRMPSCAHRLTLEPGTRFPSHAELDLFDADGRVQTLELDSVLRFHMKGIGYGHPVWGHGRWHGELEIGGESFDPAELAPDARENVHVQHVVRGNDGEQRGIGVLESAIFGAYTPLGLTGFLDGSTRTTVAAGDTR